MKNCTCYNKNKSDCLIASRGVKHLLLLLLKLLLVKNNVYAKEIKLQSNIEAIVVTLTINNNKHITICNIYLSNRYKISLETLDNLTKELPNPLYFWATLIAIVLYGAHIRTIREVKLMRNLYVNVT